MGVKTRGEMWGFLLGAPRARLVPSREAQKDVTEHTRFVAAFLGLWIGPWKRRADDDATGDARPKAN